MRILLDECLPGELAAELAGHKVSTVRLEGWLGVQNGELLARASGRFEVFLTIDKHIQHDHAPPPDLAIVTLTARSNRIQDLRPLVPSLLSAVENILPGTFVNLRQ